MKTLMSFIDGTNYPVYIELPGDYTHLDGLTLNGPDDNDINNENELLAIVENKKKYKQLTQPTKDWNWFITCRIL